MAYHVIVKSSEAAANGDIHLDCFVESNRTGDWVLIPGGHRTLVLNGTTVLSITESASTNAQKIAVLADYFKQEVKAWGLDKSDDANEQLLELVELPVTVGL